jgi:hypothetical protein
MVKSRLLRGTVATALVTAMMLPGAATPAHATDGVRAIGQVGNTAFRLFLDARGGGLTEAQIAQAMQEFIAAVTDAQSAIITHMDALAAAPWVGAAHDAILELNSFPRLTEEGKEDYALAAVLHARQARSVFNALSGRSAAAEHLGIAIYSLYAVGLPTRVVVGLPTDTYLPDYRAAMATIVDKLQPVCTGQPGELDPLPSVHHVVYTCSTPTGGVAFFQDYQVDGVWVEGPWTTEALIDESGAGTSWELAREMLRTFDGGGM